MPKPIMDWQAVADGLQDQGIRVWTDSQLAPGQRWVESVNHPVRDSDAFVVLLSRRFEKSRHGMAELGFVMSEQRDSGKPLVPVDVGVSKLLLPRKEFGTLDARGLQPRKIAERVAREVTSRLAVRPTAA